MKLFKDSRLSLQTFENSFLTNYNNTIPMATHAMLYGDIIVLKMEENHIMGHIVGLVTKCHTCILTTFQEK